MLALQGVGVLVTRPRQQAAALCQLLEAEGASTWRLPTVAIEAIGNVGEMVARLGNLADFDVVIFTSANAVQFGVSLLDGQSNVSLAAMGPATARALHQVGYEAALQPGEKFDSESLLRHPRLEHLANQRILIIKGRHGRQFLEQELTRRGAQVTTAEVYQRVAMMPNHADLARLLDSFVAGQLQVITATSAEIGSNLLNLATPALRAEFERVHWLVPSERVARHLRECGLHAPLLQAESAEDHDLVAALVRWRAIESGA